MNTFGELCNFKCKTCEHKKYKRLEEVDDWHKDFVAFKILININNYIN